MPYRLKKSQSTKTDLEGEGGTRVASQVLMKPVHELWSLVYVITSSVGKNAKIGSLSTTTTTGWTTTGSNVKGSAQARPKNFVVHLILVPRAHDPSGLWQGSRALAWSNTGSPRFTDFSSNLIGREHETNALRILRKSGPARALEPCHRPEGSWALGTRMRPPLVDDVKRSSFTSSWTYLNLKSFHCLKGTNLLSFVIAFNWLEVLFFTVVVLKSSVRFVDYKIDLNSFLSSHRSDSYQNKSGGKIDRASGSKRLNFI